MSIFASGTEARFGALNGSPFITPPPLPNIISEWAGLLPLAVHLASSRNDYIIIGELALLGRFSVGLFPKLGTLSAYSRLLTEGRRFMDGASLHAALNRQVWDVRWGSVFPAGNGAASQSVLEYAVDQLRTSPISMPETIPQLRAPSKLAQREVSSGSTGSDTSANSVTDNEEKGKAPKSSYRRYQHLHVLRFDRGIRPQSLWEKFEQLRRTVSYNVVVSLVSIAVAVTLSLCGLYGTATVILMGSISTLLSLVVDIQRPSDYLVNNEIHDAYMLTAAHQNAMDWYLFVGDRGVVDTLLNKPMLDIPNNNINRIVSIWFRIAHLLQLAAMTFTAAQKGWDGVGLLVLLSVDRSLRWLLMEKGLVRHWLRKEGVAVEAKSFKFTGRGIMLGAMQLQSHSKVTRWMDDILVSHPRRDAFLKCLLEGYGCFETATKSLQEDDKRWIKFASNLAHASAEVLDKETAHSRFTP